MRTERAGIRRVSARLPRPVRLARCLNSVAARRRSADYTSAPAEAAMVVGVWVQGYMTALNQALPDVKDVTGGRTDQQLADALFSACRNDPHMLLADASRELALKLIGKPGKKTAKAEAPAEAAPALRR